MSATLNYGWTKPTVGGDNGAWGSELNTSLDGIDTQVKATDTVAAAALPKAGGAMTGRVDLFTTSLKRVDKGSISGAQAFDLATANAFVLTLGGAMTPSFTNPPAGTFMLGFVLVISNGGSAAITWPGSVKWPSGAAPALTVAGKDILVFTSVDGGTTWNGVVSAKDVR